MTHWCGFVLHVQRTSLGGLSQLFQETSVPSNKSLFLIASSSSVTSNRPAHHPISAQSCLEDTEKRHVNEGRQGSSELNHIISRTKKTFQVQIRSPRFCSTKACHSNNINPLNKSFEQRAPSLATLYIKISPSSKTSERSIIRHYVSLPVLPI